MATQKKNKSKNFSIGMLVSSIVGPTLLTVLLNAFFNESPLLEGYRRVSNVPPTLKNFLLGWLLIFLIVGCVLLIRYIEKKREQSQDAAYQNRKKQNYNKKER